MKGKILKQKKNRPVLVVSEGAHISTEQLKNLEAGNVININNVHSIRTLDTVRGLELYKLLKKSGFPQGGQGNWYQDPNSEEKYYIPTPDEIFTQFLADPSGWGKLVDAMARAWIENKQ